MEILLSGVCRRNDLRMPLCGVDERKANGDVDGDGYGDGDG